ncbi:MAG: hypothetical protein RBU30_27515, partial [Polyangia bacterium]|nr:hypothetical protein [Polyangia bacterium]
RPRKIASGTTSISDNSCGYAGDYIPYRAVGTECQYSGSGSGPDQVYYFVLTTTKSVTFDGCVTGNYDSTSYVRKICGTEGSVNQPDCNDDGCSGDKACTTTSRWRSSLTTSLGPGLYYYLQDGWDSSMSSCGCGSYTFNISGI